MATSTPPTTPYGTAAFRLTVKASFNADITLATTDADILELLVSIRSFTFLFLNVAARNDLPAADADAVREDLHVLWHMVIEAAQAIHAASPLHDKLLVLLLSIQEVDAIQRANLPPKLALSETWEEYGFFKSLGTAWEEVLISGTSAAQCNLAAFTSKALATGLWKALLAPIALSYFAFALEGTDEAAIALLPATTVWFENANLSLMGFSFNKVTGFDIDRWLRWRARLQKLAHHEDVGVVKEAKQAFLVVVTSGKELGWEVDGEARFDGRLKQVMFEALGESGKESLGVEEVDFDVDWVDRG